MQIKSLLVVAAAAASVLAVDPSVPTVGQQNRYRALPRGSNLSLVPVDGAEFLAGQHFDIAIELHSESNVVPDLSNLSVTINGKKISDVIVNAPAPYKSNYTGATYFADSKARDAKMPTKFAVARASWRNLALPANGEYNVEITAGSEKVKAKWVVKGSGVRKAKNALLFIGDGMAPTMISAARYISKNTRFGKFANGDGFLEMERWETMGKISTNGIDAIITDSANSAAAYTSGHKGWVNTLNVYADTTVEDSLDDAKVETITEVIRRVRPGMCIGVVTTASVVDATPAAFFGHTRQRGQGQVLVDQALNGFTHLVQNGSSNVWSHQGEPMPWGPAVKPDVLLGGGGEYFKGKLAINSTNYYDAYAAAGYKVVHDKVGLESVTSGPVLGIFHKGHMDTWYERAFNIAGLSANTDSSPKLDGTTATNQPGLELMTTKAIEIMEKKCTDGWFLLSEAAAVDKSMHPMDYDRGLADLLELDRTLKAVRALPVAKDTAIFLTADHSQGYDVYGSVDLSYFRSVPQDDSVGADGKPNTNIPAGANWHAEQRNAIGVYNDAGWVDNVLDENGLPTKFADARFRLAGGKVDMPNHIENFEFKAVDSTTNPLTRNPSIGYKSGNLTGAQIIHDISPGKVYVADPHDSKNGVGLERPGNMPVTSGSTVHTLQAVDLYCWGPVAITCGKHMDNTELFFLMADALGLGADQSASYGAPAAVYNSYQPASGNAAYVAPVGTGAAGNKPGNLYSSASTLGASVFVAVAAMFLF
ncbi:alkaline phosphatase-like protein [Rhizoclosmatium globosum]|uniref:alkaline phosphatase n=1 Tax=Rhizoclosmatium globosum TaxID=329046 RepID=A0A1Y2CZV3_9FUNG|nr:alkaline phosphatase-like protein [Rhizoclosmatium globosum]|eukprot:ORY52559.1 alkaline phosphatase-like protein [Rhizoclosmatium globosum]